ncbi:hypothetical protein ACLQ2N_21950 [Streptomyces sp. DT224]|uniref:hypothetical protein n=1 Tax=Streptomyces sp. DT224 TaxID=3393426 RepID=UPI003CFAA4ED
MSTQPTDPPTRQGALGPFAWAATRVLAAAGLAVDAYLHAHLAARYDTITSGISQGTLFRLEAALAALAALLVLFWRRLPGDLFAAAVAIGGLALLLVYRYVNVGELGPIPDMYEPVWYGEKQATAMAQAVAALAMLYLLLTRLRRRRAH